MTQYHEPPEELSDKTRDATRALVSLKEEIEAIYWYQQRAETTNDEQLRKILEHNRDEEIEHACMSIEWLRRNFSEWQEPMETYLFTEGDIVALEEEDSDDDSGDNSKDLGIGKL